MKDNTPMPNVLVKIYLTNNDRHNYQSMTDSTWTNEKGEYKFTIKRMEFKYYRVNAHKEKFLQTSYLIGPWGGGFYYRGGAFYYNSGTEFSLINSDIINFGREAILKIDLDNQDTTNRYSIFIGDYFPPDTVEYSHFDSIPKNIIHIYRYEDNTRKYVSWYKKYNEEIFTVQETVVSDLVPFDTTYVNFVLE